LGVSDDLTTSSNQGVSNWGQNSNIIIGEQTVCGKNTTND